MGEKQDQKQKSARPVQERRADSDRRQDSERRGPLRWDPKNKDRRSGEDRRRPGYLADEVLEDPSSPDDKDD